MKLIYPEIDELLPTEPTLISNKRDYEKIHRLIESLQRGDSVPPISIVRYPRREEYLIHDGHTRSFAAHRAQKKVPAIIIENTGDLYVVSIFEAGRYRPDILAHPRRQSYQRAFDAYVYLVKPTDMPEKLGPDAENPVPIVGYRRHRRTLLDDFHRAGDVGISRIQDFENEFIGH